MLVIPCDMTRVDRYEQYAVKEFVLALQPHVHKLFDVKTAEPFEKRWSWL
jgi:hypothetical protein